MVDGGRSHSARRMRVVSSTCKRNTHDMFDFESKCVQTQRFNVQGSTAFVREGFEVQAVAEGEASRSGKESLIRLVERCGRFWVDRVSASLGAKRLWIVVQKAAAFGQPLAVSDVFKLGVYKLRVRQLVTGDEGRVVEPDLGAGDVCVPCVDGGAEPRTCRICLMEGGGEEDPLIRPCRCKGTIEHVHLRCLRSWTRSRLRLGEHPLGSYSFAPVPCELCRTTLPTYMLSPDGTLSALVHLPQTRPPYVVLESVSRDGRSTSRSLHVMSLAERALTLGRGHENALRIADSSISRRHASIRFENGEFLLQDNDSKFGTLMAMRRPREIRGSSPVLVQVGHTVLGFSLHDGLRHGAGRPPPGAALQGDAEEEQEEEGLQRIRMLFARFDASGGEAPEAAAEDGALSAHDLGDGGAHGRMPTLTWGGGIWGGVANRYRAP